MKKKKEVPKKAGEILQVHKELEGFEIGINSLGEIVTNFDIDTINAFLNKNVADKKLKDRDLGDDKIEE
jgi:hypothetical protein